MAKIFSIQPHVRSMIDEDGAVLLDLKAGKYYSLNPVAAAIWTRVEKEQDEEDLMDEVAALFKVPADRLQADVRDLVAGLEQKGLIRVGV